MGDVRMKIGRAKGKRKEVGDDLNERDSKCSVCGEDRLVINLGTDICSDCSIEVMVCVIAFNMHLFAGKMMSVSTIPIDHDEIKCSVCGSCGCTFELKCKDGNHPFCYQCAARISEFARSNIHFDEDDSSAILRASREMAKKYLCMACDKKDSCDEQCINTEN